MKDLSGNELSAVQETRKSNILFIIDLLWAASGTENHLFYLAKNLNKAKFNCIIVTFDLKEILVKMIRKEGIKVYHLPLKRIYSPIAFQRALELREIIKGNRIDIVQTYHFKSDTYGVLVSKMSGVRRVISSRRDTGELKTKKHIYLNKLVNKYVTRFIAVCKGVGDKLNSVEGIARDKMVTLYNGVDLERFNFKDENHVKQKRKELGISEDSFVVGVTAAFRPEKAYHIFFDGIEKVMPFIQNLKVLVLGDGSIRKRFESYCNNGHLKDTVKFMGHVGDVENYLSVMDVFCLIPNKNEGFSNAILEAMASSKPVIATDIGGNAEAVIHEETGYIIPPDDPDSLAEAILKMHKDPLQRAQMGRNSRIRVEKHFSLGKMIKDHENLYEEIMRIR